MAKDKGVNLPSSGGLTNFGKEVSSKILIDPKVVIVLIVVIIIVEFMLHQYGNSFLL